MGSATVLLIGLPCVLVSVGLYCVLLFFRRMRMSRAYFTEVVKEDRADGMDPDMLRLRIVAQVQARQRPGWHPLERAVIRMEMRAWKQTL